MQKITPCLWFNNEAEEAVKLYVSIFNGNPKAKGKSRVLGDNKYSESGAEVSGQPAGSVMTVAFELEGQKCIALNGGPVFKFTEAVSFMVDCETQEEVDYFWDKLLEGGEESQCGWLKDKFGLSWQIVPRALTELLGDPDPVKAERVMQAMLKMVKIDIEGLKKAHRGE